MYTPAPSNYLLKSSINNHLPFSLQFSDQNGPVFVSLRQDLVYHRVFNLPYRRKIEW